MILCILRPYFSVEIVLNPPPPYQSVENSTLFLNPSLSKLCTVQLRPLPYWTSMMVPILISIVFGKPVTLNSVGLASVVGGSFTSWIIIKELRLKKEWNEKLSEWNVIFVWSCPQLLHCAIGHNFAMSDFCNISILVTKEIYHFNLYWS